MNYICREGDILTSKLSKSYTLREKIIHWYVSKWTRTNKLLFLTIPRVLWRLCFPMFYSSTFRRRNCLHMQIHQWTDPKRRTDARFGANVKTKRPPPGRQPLPRHTCRLEILARNMQISFDGGERGLDRPDRFEGLGSPKWRRFVYGRRGEGSPRTCHRRGGGDAGTRNAVGGATRHKAREKKTVGRQDMAARSFALTLPVALRYRLVASATSSRTSSSPPPHGTSTRTDPKHTVTFMFGAHALRTSLAECFCYCGHDRTGKRTRVAAARGPPPPTQLSNSSKDTRAPPTSPPPTGSRHQSTPSKRPATTLHRRAEARFRFFVCVFF